MRKIIYARNFSAALNSPDIKFTGISGSVSYEPEEGDDVDIFIVTEDNSLWLVLLKALLMRRLLRMHDICLSLCIEQSYAKKLFAEMTDPLILRDSMHVIPMQGTPFYEDLLSSNPKFPGYSSYTNEANLKANSAAKFSHRIFSALLFVPVATFLVLKGLAVNHHFRNMGREVEAFNTVIGRNCFFLDTDKYKLMRSSLKRGD